MAKRDEKGRFMRTKPDYKAMYEAEKERRCGIMIIRYDARRCDAEEQRDFLLEHAGPILRWRYNRKFKKG